MAGLITHMVIAKEILKLLPEGTIKKPELFYLGALAPDAVHAREDYIRAYKKHTHFRDDIMDSDFEQEDNYALYQGRLLEFIQKNQDRKDDLIDLYRGYVVHILTDEEFIVTLRKEFCETMEKQGIGQYNQQFFDYIIGDMNRNDLLLAKHDKDINEIKAYLENVEIYPVEGYLSKEEMEKSRDWLIRKHFYNEKYKEDPIFISYEKMLDFIQQTSEKIVKKLSDEESPYHMF